MLYFSEKSYMIFSRNRTGVFDQLKLEMNMPQIFKTKRYIKFQKI